MENKYSGEGYYFDINGQKHEGKIKLKPSSWGSFDLTGLAEIKIKAPNGDKNKIPVTEIRSMVIGSDSFIVIDQFVIERKDLVAQKETLEKEFLKVAANGKITVYQQFTKDPSGPNSFYEQEFAVKEGDTTNLRRKYGFLDESAALKLIQDDKELYQKWEAERKAVIRKSHLSMIGEYNRRNQ